MIGTHSQNQLQLQLAPLLPGTLALLNIADSKRRNLYLGHERVDQDIAELDQMLKTALSPSGAACRIAGDQWLLVLAVNALPTLQSLVERFAQTEMHKIRFRSWAQSAGKEPLEAIEVSREPIQRQLRCLYTPCTHAENLWNDCTTLQQNIGWAAVGQVIDMKTLQASERPENFSRWRCIDDDQRPPLRCLICQGESFDWTGGASDCAEGNCLTCGASVDFRWGGE